jgi:rhodanese-related sulfurtransferase
MKLQSKYIIFLFFALLSQSMMAQSMAYKTLLKGVYDKDFPLVHFDQEEIFQNAVLLDTREKGEYEVSHLEGARWVGYDDFSFDRVKDIPKDQTIIVYCSIGARSQDIGKKLKAEGFKEVYNLYGGIFHWVNEGHPVFKGNEETNEVHAYNKIWGMWLTNGKKIY